MLRDFSPESALRMALDRRWAAVHEAGHFVIGRHLGADIVSAILVANHPPPGVDERNFIGQVKFRHESLWRMSNIRRMCFAVSGMVAEEIWKAHVRCDDTPLWEDVLMDTDCMSDSDWRFTGCGPGEWSWKLVRACERVEALLSPVNGPLWPSLCVTSRALIREATRQA